MVRQSASPATISIILLIVLMVTIVVPSPVQAIADIQVPMPTLEQFAGNVANGDPDDPRGLYIAGVLADPIVSQPEGMATYVSSEDGVLTRFELAEHYESYGLLAHNTLAGGDFFELEKGQIIYLVFGDGNTETYVVRHFLRYQALSPSSVSSDFIDLLTGKRFSASQVFMKAFDRPGHVILQTCIYANGDASWGRMFVIAVPLSEYRLHAPNDSSDSQ